jgi:putative transposase
VEGSDLSVKQTLEELQVNGSSFYGWYGRYRKSGYDGVAVKKPHPKRFWNRIPDEEKEQIVAIALEHPEQSPTQLACFITDTQDYFIRIERLWYSEEL